MADLTEAQIRELFRAMNKRGSSTNNLATTGRANTAREYNGGVFIKHFDDMLEENFNIAENVHKKFGA